MGLIGRIISFVIGWFIGGVISLFLVMPIIFGLTGVNVLAVRSPLILIALGFQITIAVLFERMVKIPI